MISSACKRSTKAIRCNRNYNFKRCALVANNDRYLSTFQELFHDKQQIEAHPPLKSVPLLKEFGLEMKMNDCKSYEWLNDWSFLRENVFDNVLKCYIQQFANDSFLISENNNSVMDEFKKQVKHMLYETNIGGKNNRGLLHISSFYALKEYQSSLLTERDVHNTLTIALCIEALQSYCLVMDDISDESTMRRGSPCWYLRENVGIHRAINDGPMIESFLFWILKEYIIVSDHEFILLLINLFRTTLWKTQIGQTLDLQLSDKDPNTLQTHYTMDRYLLIAKYKTAFYTFYLPYASALILAGYHPIKDEYLFFICEYISIEMGVKFQITDDFLDCFGNENTMGKCGTDIQDFKCSWVIVQALQLLSESNEANINYLEIFKKHYGKHSEYDIAQIKEIYKVLDLENIYRKMDEESYEKISQLIQESTDVLPSQMFTKILQSLQHRTK